MSIVASARDQFRRFQSWMESFAERPYALVILFLCGFVEASFFPLSPDILLIALGVSRPRRALLYAFVVVGGSTLGALLGYAIGYGLYDVAGRSIVESFGARDAFQLLLLKYQANAWMVIGLAGFTAIPFFIFTIAAGFNATVDPATLLLAALIGRTVRFLPLGVLLYFFGPKVQSYFEKYLGRTFLAIGFILILMLLVARGLL
jgi:membrane protein YqaA with SNARE-associated domain